MATLLVVLLVGATIRLTRLITADALLERPRSWIEKRLPESLAYLLRCDWCMSVWVGLAVFILGRYAPDTPVWIVAGALTASQVTGWSMVVSTAIEVELYEDDDVPAP